MTVLVSLAEDELYPVYSPFPEEARGEYGTYVELSDELYQRWLAAEAEWWSVQEILKHLFEVELYGPVL